MPNDSSRTPLVIDGDLRTITVPTDYVFGVYNDKDVLAVPFVCPRYMDDIDLSELSIRVNFTNSTGTSSYYDVPSSDVTINTDTIEFTWLLGSAVFTGSGKVTFAVCLRKVEEDGRITREFNTTLASAKVLEGLEVENQNDPAQYSILTSLQNIADSVNSSIESAEEYAEQLRNYVGSPLVANTSTDMVDVSRVYVYTGNETGYSNGHWYYYNNATWHDGGNYNAVANGIYPDLTAGNVLLGRTQSDRAPYLLRKTGNRLNKVGYSCFETIVGASVGWNQQARELTSDYWEKTSENDGTVTFADGECTYTVATPGAGYKFGFCSKNTIVKGGHKYIISMDAKTSGVAIRLGGDIGNTTFIFANSLTSSYTNCATIISCAIAKASYICTRTLPESGNVIKMKNLIHIDLTQLLGTSIADYIYSLEQATAGSGIAKLREWGFCTGYVPFNAGSIESVEVTEKKVVGFNQWNEEWEVGGYNSSTGDAVTLTDRIRGKNYIPVIPSATYYFAMPSSASGNVFFYDANKAFLSSQFLYAGTFSVPSNAYYLHIAMQPTYGTTYNHDICINLSSDRNGEYEPYVSHTYDLGSDVLRGIFKLDASNNLYADGDVKSADVTITRKYWIVDLGTLNWQYDAPVFYASMQKYTPLPKYQGLLICVPYINRVVQLTNPIDMSIFIANSQEIPILRIADSRYTDAVTFKQMLTDQNVKMVYELATPTTETSTPFTSPQTVYPDGTEEFITENGVPVGHETNYPYDMKSISEELLDIPDVPSTNGTYVLKATRSASGLTYTWVTG